MQSLTRLLEQLRELLASVSSTVSASSALLTTSQGLLLSDSSMEQQQPRQLVTQSVRSLLESAGLSQLYPSLVKQLTSPVQKTSSPQARTLASGKKVEAYKSRSPSRRKPDMSLNSTGEVANE